MANSSSKWAVHFRPFVRPQSFLEWGLFIIFWFIFHGAFTLGGDVMKLIGGTWRYDEGVVLWFAIRHAILCGALLLVGRLIYR